MIKAFELFLWENEPSVNTPLGETLLNKVNVAVNEIDNRVLTLDSKKANQADLLTAIADVTFDETTGIITFTKKSGAQTKIDTKMEKLAVNFKYDTASQNLIITLEDGSKQYVDMRSLITELEFLDSDTVLFSVGVNGDVKAHIAKGSITAEMLDPDYRADIELYASQALSSATNAKEHAEDSATAAKMAESYTHGKTGAREGEDTDNAKYYMEQAKAISGSGVSDLIDGTIPAAKATADADGNNISETYLKKDDVGTVLEDVEKLIDGLEDGSTVVGKAVADADGNEITKTYSTKEEVEEILAGIESGETPMGNAAALGGETAIQWQTKIDNIANGTTTVGNANNLGGKSASDIANAWDGYITHAVSTDDELTSLLTTLKNSVGEGGIYKARIVVRVNLSVIPGGTYYAEVCNQSTSGYGWAKFTGYWDYALTFQNIMNDGVWKGWKTFATTADLANYLPNSGAPTINGTLKVDATSPLPLSVKNNGNYDGITFVSFEDGNGATGGLGTYGKDKPSFITADLSKAYDLLHSGNIGDYALPKSGGDAGTMWFNDRKGLITTSTDHMIIAQSTSREDLSNCNIFSVYSGDPSLALRLQHNADGTSAQYAVVHQENTGKFTYPAMGKTCYHAYVEGGNYLGRSYVTGRLRITLPRSWSSTMIKFRVSIYVYNYHSCVDYIIGGYIYRDGANWLNTTAIAVGSPNGTHYNLPVRFAHDGNKCVVTIGNDDTSWGYPQVAITDVIAGFDGYEYDKWRTGWSVSFTEDNSDLTQHDIIEDTGAGYIQRYNGTAVGSLNIVNNNNGRSHLLKNASTTADYGLNITDSSSDGKSVTLTIAGKENNLYFRKNDNTSHTVLHTGNFRNYALPLTENGATIIKAQNTYNRTIDLQSGVANASYIGFRDNTTFLGALGFHNGYVPVAVVGDVARELLHTGNVGNYALTKNDPYVEQAKSIHFTLHPSANALGSFIHNATDSRISGGVGAYGSAGEVERMYIAVDPEGTNAPYTQGYGLDVYKNAITWKNKDVHHDGNSAKVAIQESAPTDTTALWVW